MAACLQLSFLFRFGRCMLHLICSGPSRCRALASTAEQEIFGLVTGEDLLLQPGEKREYLRLVCQHFKRCFASRSEV